MAFCGKCGAPLNGGKFCPNCGAPAVSEGNPPTAVAAVKTRKTNLWLIIAATVIVIIGAVFMLSRCAAVVDEPCDWCGSSPSVAYKMSDGSYSYVCKECSKQCFMCGKKATKHYENLAGMMSFACDDCYESFAKLLR